MRYFYEMYPDAVICPQVEDELITDANMPTIEEIEAELNEQLLVLCQALDEEAFKQFMGE